MKYICLFLSLFVTTNMGAQIIKNKESAILEVHYIKTTVTDTLKYRSYSDLMTLRVGKTSAMFYPTKRIFANLPHVIIEDVFGKLGLHPKFRCHSDHGNCTGFRD